MDHRPDYKTISNLNDLKDRIDLWINHNRQPLAYGVPAEDLGELAARLAKIAGDHMVHEVAG
jgi:hypothetical protein